MPQLMTAALADNYGTSSVLKVGEAPKPSPSSDEVLVRIHYTTVNRTDSGILSGRYLIMRFFTGLRKPNPPILGTDFAGKVEAIGPDVKDFQVGDNVFGFDDQGLESHAEYMNISEKKGIAKMPSNITFQQAAASIEGAHYAYNVISSAKVKKGQKVLVNGATGAIGSAAVQLLNNLGAEVSAVCGGIHKDTVRSMGAQRIYDYQTEDFTQTDERFHFILDMVGKSSFGACKPLLLDKGVYISSELGQGWENIRYAIATPFLLGKRVKFPIPIDCRRSILHLKDLMRRELFTPLIDREYPLEHVQDTYTYVFSGEKIGNVLLRLK